MKLLIALLWAICLTEHMCRATPTLSHVASAVAPPDKFFDANCSLTTTGTLSCSCPPGYWLREFPKIGRRKIMQNSAEPSSGVYYCDYCSLGEILVNNTCIRCKIGEWSTYLSTSCTKCPHGTTTPKGSPGGSASDCIVGCKAPVAIFPTAPYSWKVNCVPCDVDEGSIIYDHLTTMQYISGITAVLNTTGSLSTSARTLNNYTANISYDKTKRSCGDMAWLIQSMAGNGLNCAIRGPDCIASSTASAVPRFVHDMARAAAYGTSDYCYNSYEQAKRQSAALKDLAVAGGYEIPLVEYYKLSGRICIKAQLLQQTKSPVPLDRRCIECRSQRYVLNRFLEYECEASVCCGTHSYSRNDTSALYCPKTIRDVFALATEEPSYITVSHAAESSRFGPFLDYCYTNREMCRVNCSLGFSCPLPVPPNPPPTASSKPTAKPTPTPTAKPTRKPTKKPTKKPTEKPTKKPAKKPTKKLVKEPAKKPIRKPAEKPTKKPIKKPTKKPTKKPVKKPTKKPTNKPTQKPTPAPTCVKMGDVCGASKNPRAGESAPCSLAAREGTSGTCCQFDPDSNIPLICSDFLCVPAFDPGSGNNCSETPNPCSGLTTVVNAASLDSAGTQVVVADAFKSDINHLISCAGQNIRLRVNNTARCGVPNDSLAKDKSDHQMGMAIDVNVILDGKIYNRDQMFAAWCAYNMNTFNGNINPCHNKFGNSPPPQNDSNDFINKFLRCAGSQGLSVGASYKLPDGNHFQRGHYSANAATAFQGLLKKYCTSACSPHVPRIKPSPSACECSGYNR